MCVCSASQTGFKGHCISGTTTTPIPLVTRGRCGIRFEPTLPESYCESTNNRCHSSLGSAVGPFTEALGAKIPKPVKHLALGHQRGGASRGGCSAVYS